MFKEIVEDARRTPDIWAITKAHHEHFVLRWANNEIHIHEFNLPKFWCTGSMHFSYEIKQSTKGK